MIKIDNCLNNIFDQYDQEENRITNAFLQTLAKNRGLLKVFIKECFNIQLGSNANIVISSQKKPLGLGDEEKDKEKTEGIPDGWIVIDEEKAIVFESKIVRNAIRRDQLLAHTKRIRGYSQKYLCVVTPDEDSPVKDVNIPNVDIAWISWRDVYNIVSKENEGQDLPGYLINQLKEYLIMKEDLVGFQGIDYPSGSFDPREAKIIIKSLIREIKPDILKVYPHLKFERKSYTHNSTWSVLAAAEDFTLDIHITFWLGEERMFIGITVPNNAKIRWKRLRGLFKNDKFLNIFVEKLLLLRKRLPNLSIEFVQRHFIGRRNEIHDGTLNINLDTIKGRNDTKANPQWLGGLRELVGNKKGYCNCQFMLRTEFFDKDHPEIKTSAFKDKVIKTVYEFKEIYDYLVGSE
jgi:hypothetical protein